MLKHLIIIVLSAAYAAPAVAGGESRAGRFAVEVLGLGGPIADDGRAGSGYLVWSDGEAKALVDAGGGVFLRFSEADATVSDLDYILVSHFHADHVADLAALLKSGSFEDRVGALFVVGPSGNTYFPGLNDFLNKNFDHNTGAYRYLSSYVDAEEGWPQLDIVEISWRT